MTNIYWAGSKSRGRSFLPPLFRADLIPLRGGLGNQLFCWAYGQALKSFGHAVFYDKSSSLGRGFELQGLIPKTELVSLNRRVRKVLMSHFVGVLPWFSNSQESPIGPLASHVDRFGITNHWGYWQSVEYFAPVQDSVRVALQSWLQISAARADQYCAVHVRRGDYVSDPGAAQTIGVLPLEYYVKAIAIMRTHGESKFVIYSDDREWVSKTLLPIFPDAELPPAGTAMEDFLGIANASSVITANSSFSWWATFVGERDERPVICPKNWFLDPTLSDSFVVPDRWEKI